MTNIIKASGEIAQFDKEKLRRSLVRVNADRNLIDEIVKTVEKSVSEGMKTRTIYQIAFRVLKKKSKIVAAKYHLKAAILRLGSSGFPFEKYVAELLRYQNMSVTTNQIVKGKCVNHEVDVLAKAKYQTIFVECKYHHAQGVKTDLKVSLYVKARFDDLSARNLEKTAPTRKTGWLVTNTRFSSDAIKFGTCAELHLIGWDFPKVGSLKEIIESSGLYPVTCITNLNQSEISQLLAEKIVLCRNIFEQPNILDHLRIPANRKASILSQCEQLCFKASKKPKRTQR
jgi:hypothetical protein